MRGKETADEGKFLGFIGNSCKLHKKELSSSVFVILQLQSCFNVGLHNNISLQHTLEPALDLWIYYFFPSCSCISFFINQ